MNTLNIEKKLAAKYGYAPLSSELSKKYREYFQSNIPEFLSTDGGGALFTCFGSKVCEQYDRIVIGDYGAFVEFSHRPEDTVFIIAPGQEYRADEQKYTRNIKYYWLTIDDGSGIKIYLQKRGVDYADYKPGKYYVSVHEVYLSGEEVWKNN